MTEVGQDGDRDRPILLVGFLNQGNLGLGYLAAVLEKHGYRVLILDVESEAEEILRTAREARPLLIGFSLIFQFYLSRFADLITRLRAGGVGCHFTMGGHFPTLSWQATLERVPGLDSVVRFEGELTLLELVDRLRDGREWRDVQGIACVQDGRPVATPARPLIRDLDDLPWPRREGQPRAIVGRRVVPLLASRGCARTCSFCSIHRFYRLAPGKIVRTRDPGKVVDEMRALHESLGVRIFLFQDDDFPMFGPVWKRWVGTFLDALHRAGLPGRAIWKISCRADALEGTLLRDMREAGLYLVYIGLESGSDTGLDTLSKGLTVEQNLRAVRMVKEAGLMLQYGFMMFDPSTTFDSLRANLAFLREVVGDGSAAAVFCRMLPYDGTPIEAQLEEEGRLRGDIEVPDYSFLDPRMDRCYEDVAGLVRAAGWSDGRRGLAPQVNWAFNEVAILDRLFPPLAGRSVYESELRALTREANELLFQVVAEVAAAHESGRSHSISAAELASRSKRLIERLRTTRDGFVAANQQTLLATLAREERLPEAVAARS